MRLVKSRTKEMACPTVPSPTVVGAWPGQQQNLPAPDVCPGHEGASVVLASQVWLAVQLSMAPLTCPPVQVYPPSIVQVLLQPSKLTSLPSSQVSAPERWPSPHAQRQTSADVASPPVHSYEVSCVQPLLRDEQERKGGEQGRAAKAG